MQIYSDVFATVLRRIYPQANVTPVDYLVESSEQGNLRERF